MKQFDVVVIGAGAAGMMCAIEAGRRGRSVLVVDHARAPGEKIRISGGRCNFTNIHTSPKNFLSANPSFCISALRRYTAADFIARVEKHNIAYHEKTLGQLFCDGSSRQIVDMLTTDMAQAGVQMRLSTSIDQAERTTDGFALRLGEEVVQCRSLVIASGGKSIPKMGATGFGYDLASRFGLRIIETRPARFRRRSTRPSWRAQRLLRGSVDAVVSLGKVRFEEAALFTHRGLSGPAILQISSYWREGQEIVLDLLREVDLLDALKTARNSNGRQALQTALAAHLPKRLAQFIAEQSGVTGNLADMSDKTLSKITDGVKSWRVKPAGSEGYRTAEVTSGGVDTRDLDSRTMEAKAVPGLYFIGEVVDVTGWLGGYNFQWAWASGWSAGQVA